MRWLTIAFLVLCGVLVGCADAPAENYHVQGTFNENATEEDRVDLGEEVEQRDGEFEATETRFEASELARQECLEVRAIAQEAGYVEEVQDCERADETEPDNITNDTGTGPEEPEGG